MFFCAVVAILLRCLDTICDLLGINVITFEVIVTVASILTCGLCDRS